MNTSDFITAFLNNEMTPEQERQFLVSVASSDSMRLALKSHVLLDRILNGQLQRATVPEAIRTTIFTAATASLVEPTPPMTTDVGIAAHARPVSFAGRSASLLKRASGPILVALLTLLGFSAGYFTGSEVIDTNSPRTSTALTPATQQMQPTTRNNAPAPTTQDITTEQREPMRLQSITSNPANLHQRVHSASVRRHVSHPVASDQPSPVENASNVDAGSTVDANGPAQAQMQEKTQQPAGDSLSTIRVSAIERKPTQKERINRGGQPRKQ